MITTDSHIHTCYSSDSNTPVVSMVHQALQLGLTDICLTDHMDYHFPKQYEHTFVFDPVSYVNEIRRIQKQYKHKINVRLGVETGLKQDAAEQLTKLTTGFPFDYVIGSIHIVHEMDPYYPEYWESFSTEKEGFEAYFETMYENIMQFKDYDSLGHLDYIVRYSPSKDQLYSYSAFADYIDSILKKLLEMDKALEINTAGFKTGTMPNPHMDVLHRFLELGGEKVTIGSDAHVPEYLGYRFIYLEKLLKENGLHRYVSYHGRKPVFHEL